MEYATRQPRISAQVEVGAPVVKVLTCPSTVDTTTGVVVAQRDAVLVSHLVGSGSEGNVGTWSWPTLVYEMVSLEIEASVVVVALEFRKTHVNLGHGGNSP